MVYFDQSLHTNARQHCLITTGMRNSLFSSPEPKAQR